MLLIVLKGIILLVKQEYIYISYLEGKFEVFSIFFGLNVSIFYKTSYHFDTCTEGR